MVMNDTMSGSAVLGAKFVAALTDPCERMRPRSLVEATGRVVAVASSRHVRHEKPPCCRDELVGLSCSGRGESPGRWAGAGAETLRLGGPVDDDGFMALMDGRHPGTGERLKRVGGRSKVAAFDVTFSGLKSVSVLFAIGDPALAGALVEAHESTIDAALGYLKREACRVGGGCYQSCPGEPWQRESPACAGLSLCAEEDSNLHPGIPGQGPQPGASPGRDVPSFRRSRIHRDLQKHRRARAAAEIPRRFSQCFSRLGLPIGFAGRAGRGTDDHQGSRPSGGPIRTRSRLPHAGRPQSNGCQEMPAGLIPFFARTFADPVDDLVVGRLAGGDAFDDAGVDLDVGAEPSQTVAVTSVMARGRASESSCVRWPAASRSSSSSTAARSETLSVASRRRT